MKKSIGIKLAVVAIVSLLLTGCGSKAPKVAGTYEYKITPEQLAGQTDHNGFISAVGGSQVNTLVLNEDGTYTYTKNILILDDSGKKVEGEMDVKHVFTGKYKAKDMVIILEVPEENVWDENWASFNEMGLLTSNKGKATNGDVVQCKADQSHDPLDFFLTEYYVDSGKHDSSVELTVNKDNGSFSYNEVASSEDE